MARGRKPKPVALKKMQGTYQPSRNADGNSLTPDHIETLPAPPSYLSQEGKRIFKNTCKMLMPHRLLVDADLSLLAAYANEMSLYVEIERALRKGNIAELRLEEVHGKYGTTHKIHGLHKMARESLREAMRLGVLFGITPSARAKIPGGIIEDSPAGGFESF